MSQVDSTSEVDLATALPAMLPRIWRFALRLAGDKHDAEDLVQRSCVRALERQSHLRAGSSPLSWMFSIVYSIWMNEIRSRQIRSRGQIQWDGDTVENISDESDAGPEMNLFYKQVVNAVEALPEAQRCVMLLVAVEGLSYREAANVIDVPIGTVMSRLARARATIGQKFETSAGDKDHSRKMICS